jgi:catechol 2,3-dioxygenase-like lactoylglutathione lyase family enzyme
MSPPSRLGKYDVCGFVSIVNVERAKEFYRDTLGLTLLSEEPAFALVFDAHGIMLRLGMAKELPPAHGTVLGWNVPDIAAAVQELSEAGVRFERYPPMKHDELGVWTAPSGRQSRVVQRSRRKYSEHRRTPRAEEVIRLDRNKSAASTS